MPAHRTPTEILELNGAFEKNPKRKRAVGPKSKHPVGNPPEHLDEGEKAIWYEITMKAPAGILTLPDGFSLEILCQLLAKSRARSISDAQRNQLIKLLSLFRFSPADRSRIGASTDAPPDDPFAKFMN
jgi:hypothetical protein